MLEDETTVLIITDTGGKANEYEFVEVTEFNGIKYAILENCKEPVLRIMEMGANPLELKDVPLLIREHVFEDYCQRHGIIMEGDDSEKCKKQ